MAIRRVAFRATGKVHKVWFRETAAEQGKELKVTGFVENERVSDGFAEDALTGEAQGEEAALSKFIGWLWIGPKKNGRAAYVESLKITDLPVKENEEAFTREFSSNYRTN